MLDALNFPTYTPRSSIHVYQPGDVALLNVGEAGARVVFDCGPLRTWAFHIDQEGTATWPASAIVRMEISNCLTMWTTFPAATLPASITAEGFGDLVDVAGIRYISLAVTTVHATNPKNLLVCGWGEP